MVGGCRSGRRRRPGGGAQGASRHVSRPDRSGQQPVLGGVAGADAGRGAGGLAGRRRADGLVDLPGKGDFQVDGGSVSTPRVHGRAAGPGAVHGVVHRRGGARAASRRCRRGQTRGRRALGLSKRQPMRLVVLPQALRVIIPPLTNQYLNLTKNSSLAVAIGYPDVVSIANTTLNQTGRAVECIVDRHAGLPHALAGHLGADELVQRQRAPSGKREIAWPTASSPSRRARRRSAHRGRRAPGSGATCSAPGKSGAHHRAAGRAGAVACCPGWTGRCSRPSSRANARGLPSGAWHRRLLGRDHREVAASSSSAATRTTSSGGPRSPPC